MENFITGFPATETAFRQVVDRALGEEKAGYLFDRYLEYFFTDEDARFIRSWVSTPCVCRSITAILKTTCTRLSCARPVSSILTG